MRDLLIVATGNSAEYDRLTKNIQKLDIEIKNLGIDIELSEIKRQRRLDGFSWSSACSEELHAERMQARKRAQLRSAPGRGRTGSGDVVANATGAGHVRWEASASAQANGKAIGY